jgi:hypothetical protein
MLDVIEYIIKNKNKIAEDAVSWMSEQYPPNMTPEKCTRDVKYLLDAYVTDLNSNNNIQTINIANNFWLNGVRQVKKYKTEIAVHRYIVSKIKEKISKETGDKIQALLEIFCSILTNGPVEEKDTIGDILQRYQYVREYDTSATINESVVEKCLQNAWKSTPSKNNFMNYRVTVIGPDRQDLKDAAFDLCLFNECRIDSNVNIKKFWQERYVDQGIVPQFYNVKSCSYMLIFSQRICPIDELNPWQQYSIDRGRYYEQCDGRDPRRARNGSAIEIGLFASNFAAMCLEQNLDVSHTLCMPDEPKYWREFGIDKDPFIMLIMTVGKGLMYRREHVIKLEKEDYKPDYHKVVNFLRKT